MYNVVRAYPDLERLVFGPLIASPTNRLASWGRVLASPRLIADVELAISWQLIAKNHDFCHENSKKLEKNRKNLEKTRQKSCFLAINCQLIAKRTVGDCSAISKSILASPRLVIWQLIAAINRH